MGDEKERLDRLLVARGTLPSRSKAQGAILAGEVYVNGERVEKAGTRVPVDAEVELRSRRPRYVSRGGLKLEGALDAFPVPVDGSRCLDVGASTGGFTDCLLQHGAASVTALDVGTGQLHWSLRSDPRVTVMEGVNARYVTPGDVDAPFDLITVDVAFISLRKVLPALVPLLTPEGYLIALIKPQFEAGPEDVGSRGVVRDPRVHTRVLREVLEAAAGLGLFIRGLRPAPVRGAEGNVEFLLCAQHDPNAESDDRSTHDALIQTAVNAAERQSGGDAPDGHRRDV